MLSALVVGSMAPDFEYFLRLSHNSLVSHTFAGIFSFCVPVGLIALWIFHNLLKAPLASLLPRAHQERFDRKPFKFLPVRRFLLIIASLAIGALSHIVWDSFTHENSLTTQIPFFNYPVLETKQGTLRVYKIFQHGGTVIGLGLLAFWYGRWFSRTVPRPQRLMVFSARQRLSIAFSLLVIAAIAGAWNGFRYEQLQDFLSFRHFIGTAIITGIAAIAVEIVIFALVWQFRWRR